MLFCLKCIKNKYLSITIMKHNIMKWIVEYFGCDKYKELYHVKMRENEELKLLLQELTNNQSEIIKLIKKK
tara:strand:- start:3 stop:215 length:213 start_codon:yes stop_codon:yes gene_type:complete